MVALKILEVEVKMEMHGWLGFFVLEYFFW